MKVMAGAAADFPLHILSHSVKQGKCVFDGRSKLVRYFGLGHYNLPLSVERLQADNDTGFYDLVLDPEEMDNLANPANPRYSEELLTTRNQKLNALIEAEIVEDQALFTPPE